MSTVEGIIASLDGEIERLESARNILSESNGSGVKVGFTKKAKATRHFSAAGLKRIAAAQKARWAKQKKAAKANKSHKKKPLKPALVAAA